MTDDRLLLIDGHSMAFRAYYGVPVDTFMTSTGQYTNAVYGFTSMLTSLINKRQPTHIGVAFDVSRISFRTAEYADYKGTRTDAPEPFHGQVELIHELLEAANIAHCGLDGYEADDILATWAVDAARQGMQVMICSGDRDLLQMVTDQVTVLYPIKGVGDLAEMTPAAVQAKYGVTPRQYPDLAALVGEASDNLPGVPGVGPKTAAKWIEQFGGLEDLLLRADQIAGKVGESLRAHLDNVARNRRLNALVTDLDLQLRVDDLVRRRPDTAALSRLFDVLEFRGVRARLLESLGPAEEPAPAPVAPVVTRSVETLAAGRLGAWLRANTSPDQPTGLLVCGHWARGTGQVDDLWLAGPKAVARVHVPKLPLSDESALASWLADAGHVKAMHAAKGPLQALQAQGWHIEGLQVDTELAAYLLRPDQRSFDLQVLSTQYLNRELSKPADPDLAQAMLDFEENDDAPIRAGTIADLSSVLIAALNRDGEANLLRDVELPVQRVLAAMETTGIAASEPVLQRLRDDLDGAVIKAQQAAFGIVGHEFNLSSPKQLQAILFDQLGMPKTKKTKVGYTTDAGALETLYATTQHPFLEHLLAHRDNIKLRQIVDALMRAIADDGRIHTTFQQTAAATGRLSSTDPNLQNIPIRSETGRRVREAFVAGAGFDELLSADYSQIEMRVMAHVSGDPALIEAFRSGVDFHTMTASRVFGTPPDQVTPAQRSQVKQVNYGLAYGLSAYGLSTRLGISVSAARELMTDYFTTFGHVREYLDAVVAKARQTGYTETLLGRRRYLPDLGAANGQRREMAERAALNAPIQGSAADIIKLAMVRAHEHLQTDGLRSRLLLQVHDELVFEVAPGEREQLTALVRDVMSSAMELSVPLDVSVGVGDSWASAH
ncbi:MAG: DNA polymerase I [Propionibacteriaceae bacterium]|nr:DNA polymerase I [Propionibacteriaceae bacterium]